MKLAICLAFLSVAVVAVMIFQAVRQELNLRVLKSRTVENTEQIKRKENTIIEVKSKIQAMKSKLVFVNTNIDTLKKKKTDSDQKAQDLNVEKKTSGMRESMTKLKGKAAKKKAEEDIQSLKQQILDRDKAICAFADTSKEEAR
uniref:Si:dkey-87o1.2 n=1 Tax=Sander lucioperca TaxID=283035 RepID=A0A8C9YBH3_SANLU